MRSLSFAVVLGVVGLVAVFACKKEEAPSAPPVVVEAPKPPPAPAAPAPPAAGGKPGKILGEVVFAGVAPERVKLVRASDPVCNAAKDTALDESVLVQDGKLQNVVVRISQNAPKSTGTGEVVVSQEGCAYRPRVGVAQVGQTVAVHNGDKTMHNVHTYKGVATLFNRVQTPGSAPLNQALTEKELGVMKFKCDVHPWMSGYLVITDNAFFATTNAKGTYAIEGVPPGTYTLEAWHEKLGTKTAQVTVADGAEAKADFSFAATGG